MSCISHLNLCPSSGDTENVLLQKILQSVNAGGGVAGVSSISVNGGLPQTGAVAISTGGTVTSVNGDPGPAVSLNSGEIPEVTNLYFTNARAIAATLTGFVAGAGTVTAADSILTALQKSSGTTNDLLNFRDSNAHADASIFINSGATEIVKVIGASAFISLASERLQRNIDSGKLALLGGISKSTGAYVEAHGDTSATVGHILLTTKGRASGSEGNLQIFNAAVASGAADIRAAMSWEGNWAFTPTWNNIATTFTGLKLNVTNTSSGVNSLLLDVQVAAASKFTVRADGLVGIGTTTPITNLDIWGTGATFAGAHLRAGGTGCFFYGERSEGSITAPTATGANLALLAFGGGGHDGTNWQTLKGEFRIRSDAAWTPASTSTYITFRVTPVGSTTPGDVARITSAGDFAIGTSTPLERLSLALAGGASAGIYEVLTDASNYSRTRIFTQAGNHLIRTEAAGTGTLRVLQVGTGPKVGTDIAGANAIFHGGQSTGAGAGGSALIQVSPAGGAGAGVNALVTRIEASNTGLGFFAVAPVARQVSAANLTNNVTAGGTDDTIANFTDLTIYANDAAAIRNDIYQLARKLKQVNDALRLYGLLT